MLKMHRRKPTAAAVVVVVVAEPEDEKNRTRIILFSNHHHRSLWYIFKENKYTSLVKVNMKLKTKINCFFFTYN